MESITLTLNDTSSSLNTSFYPEIELDSRYTYSCCLLEFHTYHSIPNVHDSNNRIVYKYAETGGVIEIPVGSYELDDIATYLNDYFKTKSINFTLKANRNTLKCMIECSSDLIIDFDIPKSIGPLLGFEKRLLEGKKTYAAEKPVKINHISSIRVDCDLIIGSYRNGQGTHTLYEFTPSIAPGYKIIEHPRNLIYLPVVRRRINTLNISIVDQQGKLVDFRGESITCRIHIRKDI